MMCVGFDPVEDASARVLILGTLPGAESLRCGEYYANRSNSFWRIMGDLVGAVPEMSYQDRLHRLKKNGIALWDVCLSAERTGSLDTRIAQSSIVPNEFGRFRHRLLGVVHRTGRLGANLAQLAFVDAVGNDRLRGVLARLEFRPLCFFRRVGLLLPDLDVLVARDALLAFRLLLVCRADLNKLRLGGDLRLYVRVQLGGVAIRVRASVGISADICKEQLVVSGALGAIDAASGGGDKLRVALVEWRFLQEQKHVVLYPLLQVPNREQDALGPGSGSVPLLTEAICECLLLLGWLQFGEE